MSPSPPPAPPPPSNPAPPLPSPGHALPPPPAPSSASSQETQLAKLLTNALADVDRLRNQLHQAERRASKAERLLAAATASDPSPNGHDPSAQPNGPPPASALLAAISEAEARADRAEKQRDDAESRIKSIANSWLELNRYLATLDLRGNDARVAFSRAVETTLGAPLPTQHSQIVLHGVSPFPGPPSAPLMPSSSQPSLSASSSGSFSHQLQHSSHSQQQQQQQHLVHRSRRTSRAAPPQPSPSLHGSSQQPPLFQSTASPHHPQLPPSLPPAPVLAPSRSRSGGEGIGDRRPHSPSAMDDSAIHAIKEERPSKRIKAEGRDKERRERARFSESASPPSQPHWPKGPLPSSQSLPQLAQNGQQNPYALHPTPSTPAMSPPSAQTAYPFNPPPQFNAPYPHHPNGTILQGVRARNGSTGGRTPRNNGSGATHSPHPPPPQYSQEEDELLDEVLSAGAGGENSSRHPRRSDDEDDQRSYASEEDPDGMSLDDMLLAAATVPSPPSRSKQQRRDDYGPQQMQGTLQQSNSFQTRLPQPPQLQQRRPTQPNPLGVGMVHPGVNGPGKRNPPSGTVNAQGQRTCRACKMPGRYKEGRCVEKWGPGPEGPGTVCDRCRKKMKRYERRGTIAEREVPPPLQPTMSAPANLGHSPLPGPPSQRRTPSPQVAHLNHDAMNPQPPPSAGAHSNGFYSSRGSYSQPSLTTDSPSQPASAGRSGSYHPVADNEWATNGARPLHPPHSGHEQGGQRRSARSFSPSRSPSPHDSRESSDSRRNSSNSVNDREAQHAHHRPSSPSRDHARMTPDRAHTSSPPVAPASNKAVMAYSSATSPAAAPMRNGSVLGRKDSDVPSVSDRDAEGDPDIDAEADEDMDEIEPEPHVRMNHGASWMKREDGVEVGV